MLAAADDSSMTARSAKDHTPDRDKYVAIDPTDPMQSIDLDLWVGSGPMRDSIELLKTRGTVSCVTPTPAGTLIVVAEPNGFGGFNDQMYSISRSGLVSEHQNSPRDKYEYQ